MFELQFFFTRAFSRVLFVVKNSPCNRRAITGGGIRRRKRKSIVSTTGPPDPEVATFDVLGRVRGQKNVFSTNTTTTAAAADRTVE